MKHVKRLIILVVLFIVSSGFAQGADRILLEARGRAETFDGSGEFAVINNRLEWDPPQTAVVICDMWDKHWCRGATDRVAEMAPRMNEFIKKARAKGMLIVHAPSSTVDYYKDHPARKRAQSLVESAGGYRRVVQVD
jgi:hypothetical protein